MTSASRLSEFLHEVKKHISGDLRSDAYNRLLYSTDASIYQVMPYAVLIPEVEEDVHIAVKLAAKYSIPVLPRGAGSSLAGQAVNEALVIDMSRHLDQILEINTQEGWARVQPGLVLDEFNLFLESMGWQFGPDPASSDRATMGGIVSNNSTGAHSIMYGMTADHILETKVILSDGNETKFAPLENGELEIHQKKTGLEGMIYRRIQEITQTKRDEILKGTPQHWRRCGGYNLERFVEGANFKIPRDPRFNLAKLICGAEGTLAVITEMKVNLVPRPNKTALAIVHFESLYQALTTVPIILEAEPSAVELLDNLGLTLCREVPAYARLLSTFIEGEPNCVLITEFAGESEPELKAKIQKLKDLLRKNQVPAHTVPALNPKRQKNIWTVRKVGLGLLMSIKGDHKPIPFIEDAAVPVEHLAEYVTRVEEFCNDIGTDVAYYAHASAGCLHVRPLINAKDARDVAKLPEITSFSVELLGQYGGALSSEHGDGRARSWINEQFFGPDLYALFKEVKETFDPENIFNPGNIVDSQQMTENLRYGKDYKTILLQEQIDFSPDMGFSRAVEMCNGAGVCRKKTTGTMCPSFMVTREEEHSTRGRANALRSAMSGLLPPEEFTSPRMFQVMDLCIECKACKAECPSSVDMAKIKLEFLAHYYEQHPIPLRSKLFGNVARINRLTCGWLAPVANWGIKNPFFRWGMNKWFGISKERSLPAFARTPFTDWFENRGGSHSQRDSKTNKPLKKVVLFNDTFNTYNHPQVAIAATEVLEAAGFEVILPGHQCCGRPMISKGLLNSARQYAYDTVKCLTPYAEDKIPIVGLEPSCLLTLKDEYLSLLPNEPVVRKIADQTYLFEDFITELAQAGNLQLRFSDEIRHILLHGHCHQKSLVGTEQTVYALTLPDNYSVSEVDSGCCGMAGSFGYESEHYKLSMDMAERRLLPTVRDQDKDTLIAATGVSCRQQIKHGTGRQPLHPAEIIRSAVSTEF